MTEIQGSADQPKMATAEEKPTIGQPEQDNDANVEEVDPAALKKLKIKTGVVKRLYKDKLSYEKEIVDQEAKIERFRAEGKEEAFLKQQINCLNESKMMIPDVQKRLSV